MKKTIKLALTCGDPAGIGPEIVLKILAGDGIKDAEIVLLGPISVWEEANRLLEKPVDLANIETMSPPEEADAPPKDWSWGKPSKSSGAVAAWAVEKAALMALSGQVDAMVTAPLSKEGLRAAGMPFPGHTEMLEHICCRGGQNYRSLMMLGGSRLKVVLVTTHLPIAQVPKAITKEKVSWAIKETHWSLIRDFGLENPSIAVTGLNPHAGEAGLLGTEEQAVISPCIKEAQEKGINASGPHPADSLFFRAVDNGFDAVVAMYHDQGLSALKLVHFHDGVNATLGLPIVRTSPDHGTAFDIAGKAIAKPDSFMEAVKWATTIARRRNSA